LRSCRCAATLRERRVLGFAAVAEPNAAAVAESLKPADSRRICSLDRLGDGGIFSGFANCWAATVVS
jgi:hypothetical protein